MSNWIVTRLAPDNKEASQHNSEQQARLSKAESIMEAFFKENRYREVHRHKDKLEDIFYEIGEALIEKQLES